MLDNGPEVELAQLLHRRVENSSALLYLMCILCNTTAAKKRIRVTSQTTTLSCGRLTRFDDFARLVFEIVDLPTERNVDLRCQPCG